MGEVMQRVLVNEGYEADHERYAPIPALYVWVTTLHKQHVEEVISELPVGHVSQDTRQGRVPHVVDAGPGPVLQEVPRDVQHVPLVPGLWIIMVAVSPLLQGVSHYQGVQGRVAEAVRLIDQLPEAVVHQQLQGLQRVLGGLLALEQQHVQRGHQLCGGADSGRGPALNQKLYKDGKLDEENKL